MSVKLLKKIISDDKAVSYDRVKGIIENAIDDYDILISMLDAQDDGHILIQKSNKSIIFINRAVTKLIMLKKIDGKVKIEDDSLILDRDVKKYLISLIDGDVSDSRDFSFGDGSVRIIRFMKREFSFKDKVYLDIIIRDMTSQLKAEARMRNIESLASMTTMAAGVAHEIKNPLAAMKIYTSLLRKSLAKTEDEDLKKKASSFIDVIEEETERLNGIAVDFLFAVKPLDLSLMLDDLNQIISDIITFIKPEADEKNINIVFHPDRFIPSLMLDSKLIRSAVLNLVNNSFYAMEESREKVLEIRTRLDGDFVLLSVRDTGSGMSDETQQRIFEPYFTTKAKIGTGLGLTAVLKIMNSHEGDISLSSREGCGTTFTLRFPVPISERKALSKKEN